MSRSPFRVHYRCPAGACVCRVLRNIALLLVKPSESCVAHSEKIREILYLQGFPVFLLCFQKGQVRVFWSFGFVCVFCDRPAVKITDMTGCHLL